MMQASTQRLTSRSTTSFTTPLLFRSTMALARFKPATSLVTRQGALVALQRQSVGRARRVRGQGVVEREQQISHSEALRERHGKEDDNGLSHEKDGV